MLDLRHRTADELLPLLQPLVEPGGGLTGSGSRLFLRTTPSNAVQIKRLLTQLDRAPRQLTITVRQDRAGAASERSVSADGTVVITSGSGASGVTGRAAIDARDTRTTGTRSVEQTLRVIEGGSAYITMGTAVPFTFRRWIAAPSGGWTATQNTVYYEAVTGFFVQPQLSGDAVRLRISPEASTVRSGAIERALLATEVQVRLGEWVALGGADERGARDRSGVLSGGQTAQASQRGVWVKVDLAE